MAGQSRRWWLRPHSVCAARPHGKVEFAYLIRQIMSKKLAAGLNALVLDVKTGSGAFHVEVRDAQLLRG